MRSPGMRLSLFVTLIGLLVSLPPAQSLDKNIDLASSWDKACADGKIFYPGFCKDVKRQREDFAQFQRNPDNETWFFRAGAYYLKQRPAELKQFCDDALKRHPKWVAPHYYLGKFYQANIDDEEAIAEYKKAIAMLPCFGWALMECSALLHRIGQHEEAVRVADKGIKYCADRKDLPSVDCRYYLLLTKAKALIPLKKFKEAAESLEIARQLPDSHHDPMLLNQLTEAYLNQHQWSKVIETASESIKIAPREYSAYLLRGKAYAALNKNQQALDDISFWLSVHATDPSLDAQQAHLIHATMLERLGKKELALKERQSINSGLKDLYQDTPWFAPSSKSK